MTDSTIRQRNSPESFITSSPGPESETLLSPPPAASVSKKGETWWIFLAAMSGLTAAINGVFAKLSTNDLTSSFAQGLASLFGISNYLLFEVAFRILFFILNLTFNSVMWALFTRALAAGNSTTQVSMINTSANFMATALMGWVIFSESLPSMWWLGAFFLMMGNVIIGRKDEGGEPSREAEETVVELESEERYHDDSDVDDEDVPQL